MKYFYIGLLILCLLLSACYFSTREIRTHTEALVIPLRQALQAFRAGNLSQKAVFMEELTRQWNKSEPFFASLLSHEKTTDIAEDLQELSMAEGRDFERICSRLLDRLCRIRRMDLPIPENIL